MAGTYIDMITRIQDDLVDTAVTVAQIKLAITSAIASYENKPFWFNQKIDGTFTTVAAQEYYTSSDNSDIPTIVSFYSANVTVSSYKKPLQPIDFAVMDMEQSGSISGVPYWYSYYGQKIRLYPIPDDAYTVKMSYLYKFTALVADSDTNSWMTDGEELIRQAAKRRLALDTLYDDKLAVRCKVLEDDAFDGLLEETRQKLPNKQLRIPAMLTGRPFNIYQGP